MCKNNSISDLFLTGMSDFRRFFEPAEIHKYGMKTIPSNPPPQLVDLYVRSGFVQGIKNDHQLAIFAKQVGSTPDIVEQAILDLDTSGFTDGLGLRRLRYVFRSYSRKGADLDTLCERPEWPMVGRELNWLCRMGFLDLEGGSETEAAINPRLEGFPKQEFVGRVRYQIREL